MSMIPPAEPRRNQALDAWNWRAPFASFHIRWEEGAAARPAFEQAQAYGIVVQELGLEQQLQAFGHREVLVSFSSDHLQVSGRPAQDEPGWVVLVAGVRRPDAPADGVLGKLQPGAGAVVQALLHGRTGELLLGTAVPVALRAGT